jgi:hypothetical protein
MDLVIDDAKHEQKANEDALRIFFPLVRPGGYYVIEDVGWDPNSGGVLLLESPQVLRSYALHIYYILCVATWRYAAEWGRLAAGESSGATVP